jgi:hypothetical protein
LTVISRKYNPFNTTVWKALKKRTFITSVIVDVLETLGGASSASPLTTLPLHPPHK